MAGNEKKRTLGETVNRIIITHQTRQKMEGSEDYKVQKSTYNARLFYDAGRQLKNHSDIISEKSEVIFELDDGEEITITGKKNKKVLIKSINKTINKLVQAKPAPYRIEYKMQKNKGDEMATRKISGLLTQKQRENLYNLVRKNKNVIEVTFESTADPLGLDKNTKPELKIFTGKSSLKEAIAYLQNEYGDEADQNLSSEKSSSSELGR